MKKPSQNDRIAALLERGNSITQLQALKRFGCFRLSARIETLKKKRGMPIETKMINTTEGARIAKYKLAKP
jgi:hypothetical protein